MNTTPTTGPTRPGAETPRPSGDDPILNWRWVFARGLVLVLGLLVVYGDARWGMAAWEDRLNYVESDPKYPGEFAALFLVFHGTPVGVGVLCIVMGLIIEAGDTLKTWWREPKYVRPEDK